MTRQRDDNAVKGQAEPGVGSFTARTERLAMGRDRERGVSTVALGRGALPATAQALGRRRGPGAGTAGAGAGTAVGSVLWDFTALVP